MFIAPLFIIARTWKETKCPSTEEPIRKMCICTMSNAIRLEYYSAIKGMKLDDLRDVDGPREWHTE